MVHVTMFFAGLLGLMFVGLSAHVIRRRMTLKLAIGDGSDMILQRRIRAQANFAEYVPIALILMALNELSGVSDNLLYFLGTCLVLGRISHAYSLLVGEVKKSDNVRYRSIGVAATLGVIIVLSLIAIL